MREWLLAFSRITLKTWVTKPIKEKKDKSYLQYLIDEVFYLRSSGEKYYVTSIPKAPKNITPVEKVTFKRMNIVKLANSAIPFKFHQVKFPQKTCI